MPGIAPGLVTRIREAASSPVLLEHLVDLSARLGPAWVSPRQLRPRGVPVEVQPRHLAALHPLRDFGKSGQVFAFRHEGRGGTVQPGCAISPKHTPGIAVQANTKAGKSLQNPEQVCPWGVASTGLGLLQLQPHSASSGFNISRANTYSASGGN